MTIFPIQICKDWPTENSVVNSSWIPRVYYKLQSIIWLCVPDDGCAGRFNTAVRALTTVSHVYLIRWTATYLEPLLILPTNALARTPGKIMSSKAWNHQYQNFLYFPAVRFYLFNSSIIIEFFLEIGLKTPATFSDLDSNTQ